MLRVAAAALVFVVAALSACGGNDEGCASAATGPARAAQLPAGQTWLLGVGGETRSLYAMTSKGMFVSRTRGKSWRRLGAGGHTLAFDPA